MTLAKRKQAQPVFMGSAPAIAAAAKGPKATGGVMFESRLSHKMIRWAVSSGTPRSAMEGTATTATIR